MDKTKVFISWSGERSRAIAKSLRHYLPRVIQPIEPWMSERDLEKGSQWFSEVMTAMKPCRFAIVCLTPENLSSTWLHWEAGAIAMNFESRICTYLFGELRFSDVQPPLNQFQHTTATKDQTFSLIETINKHLSPSLDPAVIRDTFEGQWTRWNEELKKIEEVEQTVGLKPRGDREVLDEILEHIRAMRRFQEEAELTAVSGRLSGLGGYPSARRVLGIVNSADATGPTGPTLPLRVYGGANLLQFACPNCRLPFVSSCPSPAVPDTVLDLICPNCGWTGQKKASEAIF